MTETYLNIDPADFEIVGIKEDQTDILSDKTVSFWAEVFHTFRRNRLALLGMSVLFIVAIMAIFVPVFSPYTFSQQTQNFNTPPSAQHWFGTDDLGRDIFVRVWVGARISLFIGLAAAVIDLIIGVLWGSIAGIVGGRVDNFMMRIADILTAVPYLLIVILLFTISSQPIKPH